MLSPHHQDIADLQQERELHVHTESVVQHFLNDLDLRKSAYLRRPKLLKQRERCRKAISGIDARLRMLTMHPEATLAYCPPDLSLTQVILQGELARVGDIVPLPFLNDPDSPNHGILEAITDKGLRFGCYFMRSKFLTHAEITEFYTQRQAAARLRSNPCPPPREQDLLCLTKERELRSQTVASLREILEQLTVEEVGYHRQRAMLNFLEEELSRISRIDRKLHLLAVHPEADLSYCPPDDKLDEVIVRRCLRTTQCYIQLPIPDVPGGHLFPAIDRITPEGLHFRFNPDHLSFLTHEELAARYRTEDPTA